jgi:hypothetical protein
MERPWSACARALLRAFAEAAGALVVVGQLQLVAVSPAYAVPCANSVTCTPETVCQSDVRCFGRNTGDQCDEGPLLCLEAPCPLVPAGDPVCCRCGAGPSNTPTATPTDRPTATSTRTATPTRTPAHTPTNTPLPCGKNIGAPPNSTATGSDANKGQAWVKMQADADTKCDAHCATRKPACTDPKKPDCLRNGAPDFNPKPNQANDCNLAAGVWTCTATISNCSCRCGKKP